jgi:ATP synthase I chain
VLAGLGVLVCFVWKGWPMAAGFALGAILAWINFLWLKRIADSMGASEPKASARGAFLFGSRYLILGAVAYVILRFTNISTPAALTGLFVSLGAVLAEIVFEIVYARN